MTDLKLSAETTHNNPASTSGALRFDTTNVDGTPVSGYTEFDDIAALLLAPGKLYGGYIQPTDTGSGLKLEVLTNAGATPSATAPVRVKINRTVRKITAACTFTIADGTNWMNAGAAETAAKAIDFFAYVVWDSADSIVALSASRYPGGRIVSSFSGTTTNEKHLVNYANFATTDDIEVCGRFEATLSAGAGYTWSVPTYTADNLIQAPIRETRWLTWTPVVTGYSGTPTVADGNYRLSGRSMDINTCAVSGTSNATTLTLTIPFTVIGIYRGSARGLNNSVPIAYSVLAYIANSNYIEGFSDFVPGGWANTGTKTLQHPVFGTLKTG